MEYSKFSYRNLVQCAIVVIGVAYSVGGTAEEPYVNMHPSYTMFMIDSSGSMNWTKKGDDQFPVDTSNNTTCHPEKHNDNGLTHTDFTGTSTGDAYRKYIPPSMYKRDIDGNDSVSASESEGCKWGINEDGASPNEGPERFGPCYVWEPSCGDNGGGDNYTRPAPEIEVCRGNGDCSPGDCHKDSHTLGFCESDSHVTDPAMKDRLADMINSSNRLPSVGSRYAHRLTEFQSTLTGQKSLGNTGPEEGPGCWIIPRSPNGGSDGAPTCDASSDYYDYPDHRAGIPLIQPVWDKSDNLPGIVDKYGKNTIFATSLMDAYTGTSPANDFPPQDFQDPMTSDPYGHGETGYNLGIDTIMTPAHLAGVANGLRTEFSGASSKPVDQATRGVAWLDKGCSANSDCPMGQCKSGTCQPMKGPGGGYMESDFEIGTTPAASATPLAPMVHDLRQTWDTRDISSNEGSWKPIEDDTFKQCRTKHAVLLTDGVTAPEKDWASALDSDLNAAYSYPELSNANFDNWDSSKYDYLKAENAVSNLVSQSDLTVSSDENDPRLHVVGLNIDYSNNRYISEKLALAKMAKMAKAGGTCAGYYLPDLIPESSSPLCDSSNPNHCSCNPNNEICLDPQQPNLFESGGEYTLSSYSYQPPDSTAGTVTCKYPALVLDTKQTDSETTSPQQMLRPMMSRMMGHINGINPDYSYSSLDRTNQINVQTLAGGSDSSLRNQGMTTMYPSLGNGPSSPYLSGGLGRRVQACAAGTGGFECSSNSDCLGTCNSGTCSGVDYPKTAERMRNLFCNTSAGSFNSGDCVNSSSLPGGGDRRRIFTAAPSSTAYNYDKWKANTQSQGRFISDFELAEVGSDYGEFGNTYLEGASSSDYTSYLQDRRVVMEADSIFGTSNSIGGLYGSSDITASNCTLKHLQNGHRESNCSSAPTTPKLSDRMLYHRLRGRTEGRKQFPLGGIHRADLVSIGPPSADVPIDSYRKFKRQHEDRLGVTYVNTTDGLLHAIYSGGITPDKPGDKTPASDVAPVRGSKVDWSSAGSPSPSKGAIYQQREAWAYFPSILHDELDEGFAGQVQADPGLNQGTPVIQDVRLCHKDGGDNFNKQACHVVDNTTIPAAQQWRTVLLSNLGPNNTGYFALDVTRPGKVTSGGSAKAPDPIPLWELDESWIYGQLSGLSSALKGVQSGGGTLDDLCSGSCGGSNVLLGPSPGKPAIGTVMLWDKFGSSGNRLRRPIGILPGGTDNHELADRYDDDDLKTSSTGNAVYITDMQTGTVLRRFVDYTKGHYSSGDLFKADITGTPVIPNNKPGKIATEAFVTDAEGRIFRIRMNSAEPKDWKLHLYFDPQQSLDHYTGASNFSAYSSNGTTGIDGFEPAITLDSQGRLRIVHAFYQNDGSGNPENLRVVSLIDKGERPKFVWELRGKESISTQPSGSDFFPPKLTAGPVVFSNNVYFAVHIQGGKGGDVCKSGPRMYAASLSNVQTPSPGTKNPSQVLADGTAWYQNQSTEAPFLGLEIEKGSPCYYNAETGEIYERGGGSETSMITAYADEDGSGGSDTVGDHRGDTIKALSQTANPPSGGVNNSMQPFSWTVIRD
jgi:hypothetical protein